MTNIKSEIEALYKPGRPASSYDEGWNDGVDRALSVVETERAERRWRFSYGYAWGALSMIALMLTILYLAGA